MSGAVSKVVIAGGGIGGLATALALAKVGIASRVCERRPTFPEEGAGIQIGPNGSRILRSLGVGELLEKSVAKPDCLSVRDGKSGRELTRLPLGRWIAARHGAPYWTALRKDLHAALRQTAERQSLIELVTDCEIRGCKPQPDGIDVVAAEGTTKASLLVGADGLWSNVRSLISSGSSPRPIGKAAFRTVVSSDDLPSALTTNAVHIWLAPGAHAVHYPVDAGRSIALVVIADEQSARSEWDTAAPKTTVNKKITAFAEPLQTLASAANEWRQWSLYEMAPLHRWSSQRMILVGDAAHPILPFLAQGAVMAIEDAVTLADQLSAAKNQTIEQSLHAYEASRQPRVAHVASASSRNGDIYQMNRAGAVARNAVMRATPPERLISRFDWLYGWTP